MLILNKYIVKDIKYITVLLLLIVFTSSLVYSQETTKKHAILTDKFELAIGIFYPSKRINAGVDGSLENEDFEFGKGIGLKDEQTTLFFGSNWRFAEKWKLSVDYFGLKNSGSGVLEEDINWDDFTFEQGTNVGATSGFNLYRIYVGRIFTRGAKHEFGGGLGVHAINLRASIEGEVLTNKGDHSFETSRKSVTIPLPNLGLWYFYAPNTKWAFTSKFDVFYIAIGDFSGNLINITPGVKYQIFKNIGASINYRLVDIGAEFKSTDWEGSINTTFYGPSLAITANF